MLCSSCQKLATNPKQKKCVRCNGQITLNLGVICESCSNTEKLCAFCLKKVVDKINNKRVRNCNCGKK